MKKLNKITLKKVNIDESSILQKSELRNIIGGGYDTGGETYAGGYGGSGSGTTFFCVHEYSGPGGVAETGCYLSFKAAVSLCQFYAAAGHNCKCYPC